MKEEFAKDAVMVLLPVVIAPLVQIGTILSNELPLSTRKAIGVALVSGITGGCVAMILHSLPVLAWGHQLAGSVGTLSGLIPAVWWSLAAMKLAAQKLNVDVPPLPSPGETAPGAPQEVPEHA